MPAGVEVRGCRQLFQQFLFTSAYRFRHFYFDHRVERPDAAVGRRKSAFGEPLFALQ